MRLVRTITAFVFAAAVAVTGCSAQATVHPAAAAPALSQRPAASPTPAPPMPRTTRPTTPTPPTGRRAVCRTAQLHLRMVQAEGAMGHRYLTYAFGNRSAVACTMSGFPVVHLLDAHGGVLPTVLRHTYVDTGPVRRVLLRPGASAFFTLAEVVFPEVGDRQPCPVATTLAVTPPQQRQALTIPATIGGTEALAPCGGRLWVAPVRPTAQPKP
jgi:Protein of unknown function (DUF4232)